jgi:hypothetical protein
MIVLSRQMLEAARVADWPRLIALGQQRDTVEARLPHAAHGDLERAEEQQLVAALLAANTLIQQMVETQLGRLAELPGDADD